MYTNFTTYLQPAYVEARDGDIYIYISFPFFSFLFSSFFFFFFFVFFFFSRSPILNFGGGISYIDIDIST